MMNIFIHGLGQTPSSWEQTLALLGGAKESVCPHLPELIRGKPATWQNLYAAFAHYCNAFNDPLNLCGLSLGGVLALQYALDYPQKVHALVLIAAPYRMPRRLLRFQNALFRLMPAKMFQETGFSKRDFLSLCSSMIDLDFTASLPRIACPTLVLCGEKDFANRKSCSQLAQLLPQATFIVTPHAGHEINVEAPAALAEALKTFWKR